MSKINGGSAFPFLGPHNTVGDRGMTLRDYFAAAALQGELAQSSEAPWMEAKFTVLAERCYLAADALLAERAK